VVELTWLLGVEVATVVTSRQYRGLGQTLAK
jgi:hypothetical protein